MQPRIRLTREAIAALYGRPLLDLVFEAAAVHRAHHDPAEVQCSQLLSIKTGACPEDCAYCPQSARYDAAVEREELMSVERVLAAARSARRNGADRFCMGAAWREVKDGPEFQRVLEMVRGVKALGLETCVTLGMLQPHQAGALKEAGLDYYNHNLDTSPEFYGEIITTRTYEDRLKTLDAVRAAGIHVCCGGILGMGESREDRIGLLYELARQDPQPESVPINALVAVKGTPLEDQPPLPWDEMLRAVAVARILIPQAKIRLSAGRTTMSDEAQALCFLAGANSIFLGDKLLTTPNPGLDHDGALLQRLGLRAEHGERAVRGGAIPV
ncbi:MAG: biotin synthase BioB [Planctomycetota bacterium]|nr:MAG: biotin synthase BioB [Planctomycetota bacterium]